MTSQQILQSDLLDILFEKRNKLYGAYLLRRTYNQQLMKAVAITIGSAFLFFFLFTPSVVKSQKKEEGTVVIVDHIVPLPEPKKPEPPKQPTAPKSTQVKQQLFTDNIQMTKKELVNPLPPQDAFDRAAVSNITSEGPDAAVFQAPVVAETGKKGDGEGEKKTEAQKEVVPDKQPQFPGGMQAWLAFLGKNLHSPEELESGEKRTVVIRFFVAEDGTITNFQVVQSAGSAFDNEVIRVLKKMPKWTPAMQAGQPVSVSFTQPVTFVGMEE